MPMLDGGVCPRPAGEAASGAHPGRMKMRVDEHPVDPTFLGRTRRFPVRITPSRARRHAPVHLRLMPAFLRWTLPGGVVAATVLAALWYAPRADGFLEMITRRYGILVFAAAGGLAVVFHRSRVLALVAGLAAVEAAATFGVVAETAAPALGLGAVVILGLGAWVRDRGVTSLGGLLQLGSVLFLVAGLVWGLRSDPDLWLGEGPWGSAVRGPWVMDGVSPAAALALTVSAVLVVLAAYRRRGPVERALVWSLAMVVASALPGLADATASLFRMGATLALGLAVLETSYAMAYKDELTGLPGRRSLARDLEGLTGTYTLAMVDVDHFKKFNDKHGHDVGDQVLRLVASRLARSSDGGRAYRYGGEEFTVLYRGVSREEAKPRLEALRAAVAQARFSLRGWGRPVRTQAGKARRGGGKSGRHPKTLSVTVSVGVADSSSAAAPEEVLSKADKALYRAKRAGRNRVAV